MITPSTALCIFHHRNQVSQLNLPCQKREPVLVLLPLRRPQRRERRRRPGGAQRARPAVGPDPQRVPDPALGLAQLERASARRLRGHAPLHGLRLALGVAVDCPAQLDDGDGLVGGEDGVVVELG